MNGFFNINKTFGISSAKAIWLLKNKLNITDKIGHMGTLDPFATGVLVVGVGRANRLFNLMLGKRKTYRTTFEFGFQTASLDMESEEIVARSEKIPTKIEVEQNLSKMQGKQKQTAPQYSAKKIQGLRAYNLARKGEVADIKPHSIEIYSFKLLEQKSEKAFVFEIECSGGTYIRSICRDLAEKMGTVATMTALVRTQCGPFALQDSKNIEDLSEKDLTPIDFVGQHLPLLKLSVQDLKRIKNGIKICYNGSVGQYRVENEGRFIGVATVQENKEIKINWLLSIDALL